MILSNLSLQNFRSYAKKTFEFSTGTTLIVGPNTAGKTNILEAIAFLATGKSFRADQDREAIGWGSEMTWIKSQISNLNDQISLEVVITQGEVQGQEVPMKKYLVNGVPRRQVDFVGNLRAVLFWPEHLELVTDSPSIRRKYLDSVLVQVDREYRRNLSSYERGLRQRNRLLDLINEGKAGRGQLLFWNQLLIKAGEYITEKRGELIDFVNRYKMSDVRYQIEYDKSVISESRLEQYAAEEVGAKATLVGPHRDDFVVMKSQIPNPNDQANIKQLSKYGSRGEQRLAVLWLKLAELSYIEQESGERPILLLDDIFSELDEGHRRLVVDLVGKQQTILTSADEASVPKEILGAAKVIRL
ncbi:MAG: DNA replication and repair protein RecF [Candidatus Gottesmanbacteria bacterium]|nr:DNA replication and repair protein RecF [Candidatus Gottesmanbacteria bacterium]